MQKTLQLFEIPEYNDMLIMEKIAEMIIRQFRSN